MKQTVLLLMIAVCSETSAKDLRNRSTPRHNAGRTTESARAIVLARIGTIQRTTPCRQSFEQENIDFTKLRALVSRSRFYSAVGPEGNLRFSSVVGRPSSPDETLRALALQVVADAFVLGYIDGTSYVRTNHIVLSAGYFEQEAAEGVGRRPTTTEEKQTLLLHELLHVALDVDDDALDRRELCTLRLITFCPRFQAQTGTGQTTDTIVE